MRQPLRRFFTLSLSRLPFFRYSLLLSSGREAEEVEEEEEEELSFPLGAPRRASSFSPYLNHHNLI